MDGPFDRTTIGFREKPSSTDHNRQFSQADRTLRDVLAAVLFGRTSDSDESERLVDGFLARGFQVVPDSPASMDVTVRAGFGFQSLPADVPADIGADDLLGVDDLSPVKPLVLTAAQTFTVPTAPVAPDSRIDIIEVRAERVLADSETRRQFDEASGAMAAHAFYKTLTFLLDGKVGFVADPSDSTEPISYKTGTPANPGVAPATTTGYVKIAEILVDSGVTSVDEDAIIDRRALLAPGGSVRVSARYRVQWNGGAPTVTMKSIIAPPGVKVSVWPATSQRGLHSIYVVGGEPTEATAVASVTGASSGAINALHVGTSGAATELVGTIDSTEQGHLAAGTPAETVAIGATRVAALITPLNQAAGTTSITAVALEDLVFSVEFDIAYR